MVTANIFILGDTSYGSAFCSCCVDEVAGEHLQADCIIHYGPACLSPTQRLPVLYVFASCPVDIKHAAQQLESLCPDYSKPVLLMAETSYQHAVDSLYDELKGKYNGLVTSQLKMPDDVHEKSADSGEKSDNLSSGKADTQISTFCKCSRCFQLPPGVSLNECLVFFIGQEGLVLTNFMMTMNKCGFLTYDPATKICRQESLNVNKALMKRYYMIECAKDASIVGIVVGTLGISGTRDIIAHLRLLVRRAGKKCYTFVVGKLSVAKLANFMEVDVFVLVACPLNSLLDSSEFYRPVVTPYEMEVACNQAREWTGDYLTDFQELLPGSANYIQTTEGATDTTYVSLISNKLRRLGCSSGEDDGPNSASLILRSDAMGVASVEMAGDYLAQRSWKGLEQKLENTPIERVREGRRGLAMSYTHETE
ncbi:2-(3-amino-3-carboxypropyl)histidine synthase subunit 2-like isoform X3 [Pomacea canaliculata]|nr:2-(3-amino-3-carboxypropyl)histidine synthase subunit 2-like isoform X3 [Pomacea canaliculata]